MNVLEEEQKTALLHCPTQIAILNTNLQRPTCNVAEKSSVADIILVKYIWFKYALNKRKLFGTLIYTKERYCHLVCIENDSIIVTN